MYGSGDGIPPCLLWVKDPIAHCRQSVHTGTVISLENDPSGIQVQLEAARRAVERLREQAERLQAFLEYRALTRISDEHTGDPSEMGTPLKPFRQRPDAEAFQNRSTP